MISLRMGDVGGKTRHILFKVISGTISTLEKHQLLLNTILIRRTAMSSSIF